MADKPIVIVGAGHAGVQAAARLAELDWGGGTVLIDQEDTLPYERPPLSKDMLKPGGAGEAPPLRKETFYSDKNIVRVSGEPAVRIDRAAKEIELLRGERVPYHKLVLATGSKPRPLRIPGAELPGVHMLKTRADAQALRRALSHGRRVVIIGAGYIGLEVAAASADLGCDVTVLEFQDRVMNRVTSDVVSHYFEALHQAKGTRFVFGAAANEVQGTGKAERVITSEGAVYPADVVVVGVGVLPNQQLAEQAGIACSDGIIVDEHCRTSDPHVYAVGDVTRFISRDEQINQRLESVQSAVAQAIAAANHIVTTTGTQREVPWFWTVQHGVRLQTAGLRRPTDDVVVRGSVSSGRFSVLYIRDGRLAAIDTVGSLKDFVPGKKLIAADAKIDQALAADPSVKLTEAQVFVMSAS